MNRILSSNSLRPVFAAVLLAAPALSQNLVTFTNGTVANANDVNANFTGLRSAVQAAQATANTAAASAAAAQPLVGAVAVDATGRAAFGATVNSGVPGFIPGLRLGRPSSNANLDFMMRDDSGGFGWNFAVVDPLGVGELRIASVNQAGAILDRIVVSAQTGDVGIGGVPTARLDVHGDMRLRTFDKLRFGGDGESSDPVFIRRTSFGADVTGLDFVFGDSSGGGAGVDFLRFGVESIDGSGYTDRFFFTSDGFAAKPGGGEWAAFSDARLKQDIEPLGPTLDRLLQLEGRTYTYKNPDLGATPGVQIGFVAQEVERVFPQWVVEHTDGMKLLSISGFEALSVEALRELDNKNRELQADNAALTARIEQLEALAGEIAQMKAAMAQLLAK